MGRRLRNIAIIPARGGSKRLPRKNMKVLGGVPLIVHSINYAMQNADIIDHIVVSTDDEEIKKVAEGCGASVIDRPPELSGDYSTTLEVIQHVIDELDPIYKNIVLLQPTNPLRPFSLLREAYDFYITSKATSLFTVSKVTYKLGKITKGRFLPINYRFGERSQDLEPLYKENGLLYITSAELLKTNCLLNKDSVPFIIDHPFESVDIDTLLDFKLAEFLLKNDADE